MSDEYVLTPSEAYLEEVYRKWYRCQKCEELARTRTHIVFGVGNPEADIVTIGTAPGKDEDAAGEPHVGEGGAVQDDLLAQVGLTKDDIYSMNLVCCRPYTRVRDFKSGIIRDEQRDPTKEERDNCRPLLLEILYRIDPLLIVAYGNVVCTDMLNLRGVKITKIMGEMLELTIPGRAMPIRYPVIPMFQPAYLARNKDMTPGSPMRKAEEAWKRAVLYVDALNMMLKGKTPIKERNFDKLDVFK